MSLEAIYEIKVPSLKKAISHTGETLTESSEGSLTLGYTTVELTEVPGIGPSVPQDIIETVIKYVKETSLHQQGMIMPRNIRHFTCPPLEVMNTSIL